ncbi:hypothetical protein RN001_009260 [Aquatica leii]|uniref:Tonsoku-like protein n=1 Tax=Aquatica leii TaxID=1421715 RepID=A0AAN7PTK7_9COLE|nr:hypothetical protein RN001_009260 [Aquatica leii]
MQEQKLLKRKRKADCNGDKNALASVCIDLAQMYIDQERYEDALKEYEIVAKVYKAMGKRLDFARANRGIGEAYVQLQEYDKALQYQQIYLDIAKEQKNKLEEQRALATIGHIHLTCYLDNQDSYSLNSAYKAFRKSFALCESLTDVKKHEHKDIMARLLANLGVVEECKGNYDKGIELLQKSIALCKSYDLFEQLFRGYTALAVLYDHKKMYDESIQQCNLAYKVAGRLKNKTPLQCTSLCMKADMLIKLSDFHSAKNVLLKAYKLKDSNSSNREVIEQNLKVVAAMCKAEDTLLTTASNNFKIKKSLYEKLGDGACRLKNFSIAIEYYHKMLEAANANNESGLDLIPCYISLAETYRDNKQFDMAIKYFQEDYNIVRENPRDVVNTLLNIADCMESSNRDIADIQSTYDEALTITKATVDKQMENKVLARYVPLLKKFKSYEKALMLENRLKQISHLVEESESEEQSTPNIGDDVSINDITDVSDDSDAENRPVRKRSKPYSVRKNNKGETQLHTACIKGNHELVKHLLDQGHPVNVRDNCGWLPIHEACISGFVEIVEMLIEKGANVNDRGGTLCQGITPLHDAALNGHLEVIELLLNKGASSIIKNDNGEIPLQVLKAWRASSSLSNEQLALYDRLISRLTQDAERLGLALNQSVNASTSAIVSSECDSVNKKSTRVRCRNESQVGSLRRTVSADKDFYEASTSSKRNVETPAQIEYKRAMENLKNSSRDDVERKRKSNDKVSAYVEDDLDDWLEDDMGGSNKKRKTGGADGFVNSTTIRRTSSSSSFSLKSKSSSSKSVISNNDDLELPTDFFESDFDVHENGDISDDSNIPSSSHSIGKSSLKKPKKKRQTSLIDSGFTRHRSFSPTNSIQSKSSVNSDYLARTEVFSRRNSNLSVDINNIFNTEPMLSVDVRINGKLYKVPVPASEIHTRTIKWLADEAAKRYSRKECMKPDLELETKNGAILADEDLISVLFSAGVTHGEEVEARIVKCNVLPLAERYSEACALENITPSKEVLKVLEATFSTLNLTDLNLRTKSIAPLCKVINRQINLSSLNLSGNFIHDSCVQFLCSSLPLLENLIELNLSLNQLTSDSLQYLSQMFEQSSKPILSNLINLDLSHNPLGNKSLPYLAVITRNLKLKTLTLVDVDFTTGLEVSTDLCLDQVINLDISYNKLSNDGILIFLSRLQPQVIESLNVSNNTGTCEGLLEDLVQLFRIDTERKYALKSLNVSRTHATDSEVFLLLSIIGDTYQFKSLNLNYNDGITSVSLRRLVQIYPTFECLSVIGCENIFKYFNDCTDSTWSCVRLRGLEFSCDFDKYSVEKNCMIGVWKKVHEHKAVVTEMQNFVKLSVTD